MFRFYFDPHRSNRIKELDMFDPDGPNGTKSGTLELPIYHTP